MPSKVLGFQTPLRVLQETYPTSRLASALPLKLFGCTSFVHIRDRIRGKLDPRAKRCVFVRYAPNQKGYKCFDPISKKMFITMDVTFLNQHLFLELIFRGGMKVQIRTTQS